MLAPWSTVLLFLLGICALGGEALPMPFDLAAYNTHECRALLYGSPTGGPPPAKKRYVGPIRKLQSPFDEEVTLRYCREQYGLGS